MTDRDSPPTQQRHLGTQTRGAASNLMVFRGRKAQRGARPSDERSFRAHCSAVVRFRSTFREAEDAVRERNYPIAMYLRDSPVPLPGMSRVAVAYDPGDTGPVEYTRTKAVNHAENS